MQGINSFISQNFNDQDSTFESCIHLITHAYHLLKAENKQYSRTAIQNTASKVRGKLSKIVELEDFLRNDLVRFFIEPNRNLFGLNYFQFHSGVEEFHENIKVGILDIKVCSPLFSGDVYFIFECKRLNLDIVDDYINKGVKRFVDGQYYRNSEYTRAGMISFLESKNISRRIDSKNVFSILDSALLKYKNDILLESQLELYKLKCQEQKSVNKFKFTFISHHNRKKSSTKIKIFHTVFDYNDLIVD